MVRMAAQPPATSVSVRISSPVLVGRDAELAALVEVVARRPSAVLVEGEPGMGKTRLVRELVRRPELEGLRVLSGTCQHLREPFPYGPVLEALRGLTGRPLPCPLSPVAGALRPLLPELAEVLPVPLEPLPDPLADRHREFRAIRELLGACGPVLLVLDDVHWADERTRDVLRFLAAAPPERLGLVLAYRTESGRGVFGTPFRPAETVRTARVRLGPLAVPAVRRLAAGLLDVPRIDEEFAARLHECTAGIPFVVEETLRSLRESPVESVFSERSPDAIEVPALLREAMAERLASLPETAVRLVRAAAVLAVPAEAPLIAAVAGTRRSRLPAALTEAVRGGVLLEVDRGRYGFRHTLARKAVYDTVTGPERQVLHGRALRALAETVPRPLVQLAGHAQAGGLTEQWRHYAEAAADRAIEVGDTALAIDTLQALLEGAALDEPDVERMATKLSKIALRGLRPDVTVTLERVLAERGLCRTTRGTIRLSMGMLLVRRPGDLGRGRHEVEKAIEELADRPELAARGMNLLAQPLDGLTPLAWHQEWARRADDVAARLDDPELRLTLLADRIACRAHVGDATAWTEFEALPEHTATVGERVQLSRLWCNLADAQAWCGYLTRAERLLRTGLGMATTAGAVSMAEVGRSTRLRLDWLTGNWSAVAEAGASLAGKYPDLRPVAGEAELVLGTLAAVRGEFADAERHLAATFVATPEHGVIPVVLAAAAVLIRVRLATGDLPGAGEVADRGVTAARHKGVWVWAADLVPAAVEAYALAGREADAEALLEEFARGIADRDAPVTEAALPAARGALLDARGEHAEAAERFDEAVARYAGFPMPYPATWARERAALCRLNLGEGSATGELCDAAEAYERLGATRDAGRCRHALREHGAWTPSPRGRRGYGQQLSPREREVARMLADGRTNREIADGLFLSPRTVEQHVAKVLRKLGARSRTEITWLDHDLAGPVAVRLPRQGKGRVSALG
jgi:DNA-binding CsgD family transcriptional regulator/tetratricopeptide (TPR) repeat protein